MFLAEAIPPAGPVVLPALAGLFVLCALIFAIGCIKLVDGFVRALFGTISGAVGWIPFAGKVLAAPVHQIERKISHALGTAERKMDAYVATTWHTLGALIHYLGREIEGLALGAWRLAQQAEAFVRRRDMTHAIRSSTRPLRARQATLARDQHNLASQERALHRSVAQGVYPRLKAGEVYDRTVARPGIASARAEAKAAEAQAIALFRWLTRHKLGVAAGVFTGAVAWALTRLGGGWIRCSNWRRIGRAVCGLSSALIDALLGLGLAFAVVIDPKRTAELAIAAEDAMESLIRKIAD